MQKFKAIGFDYGGVIKGVPSFVFVARVCEVLGITEGEYHNAYYSHNKKFNRNEVDRRGFWELVLAELNKPELIDEVVELNDKTFHMPLNQDVLSLVDILKENGYKVGLLTNNTKAAGEKIRQDNTDKHFNVLHVSAETGDVKPEPKAFTNLASDLGVEPREMIYIDDSPKSLSTSEEVGYTPILYIGYEELIEELNRLDINTN